MSSFVGFIPALKGGAFPSHFRNEHIVEKLGSKKWFSVSLLTRPIAFYRNGIGMARTPVSVLAYNKFEH
ncbi:hypothetical protein GCM10025751_28340 [Haladaptatus pallidirubidus]|uniref:Uncharacterized protein n=1 Tax=Haladaptatus pallidirubidus TaxID=1008152 RepID=A0AAV3UIN8_9EURY